MRANCINPTCYRKAAPYSLRCEEHKRQHTAAVLFGPPWWTWWVALLAKLLPWMPKAPKRKARVFRIVNKLPRGQR